MQQEMLLFICFLFLGHLRELLMYLTKKTEVTDIQNHLLFAVCTALSQIERF